MCRCSSAKTGGIDSASSLRRPTTYARMPQPAPRRSGSPHQVGRAMRVPVTTTSSSDRSSALAANCQVTPASARIRTARLNPPDVQPPELTSARRRFTEGLDVRGEIRPAMISSCRPPTQRTGRGSPRIEDLRGSRRIPGAWPVSASRRRDAPFRVDRWIVGVPGATQYAAS